MTSQPETYAPLQNHPDQWRHLLPRRSAESHKYTMGHAVIYAAPALTGATRLAAEAAARMGAGLVSVLADADTLGVYQASLPAHILVRGDLNWVDDRVSARLYGPGGLAVTPDFKSDIPTVLDADALIDLPRELPGHYILTPHEGEFARAFPGLSGDRISCARAAAEQSGAIVVLKGAQTLVAAPNGQTIINTHASPALATAGTGDVLAGMITGLLAQGMAPLKAACAAVWMHGEAGLRFGPGLVASDISGLIPEILQDFA